MDSNRVTFIPNEIRSFTAKSCMVKKNAHTHTVRVWGGVVVKRTQLRTALPCHEVVRPRHRRPSTKRYCHDLMPPGEFVKSVVCIQPLTPSCLCFGGGRHTPGERKCTFFNSLVLHVRVRLFGEPYCKMTGLAAISIWDCQYSFRSVLIKTPGGACYGFPYMSKTLKDMGFVRF